jgi:hypothetical protein
MKTLKNFTQKLNLNSLKIANLTYIHSIKGGAAPETAECGNAESNASNTFTLLCGAKDTVDTQ